MPPAVEVPGLNHWIDREIPTLKNFIHFFFKKLYWNLVDLLCCVSFRCTTK